jgi:hypothetical protein
MERSRKSLNLAAIDEFACSRRCPCALAVQLLSHRQDRVKMRIGRLCVMVLVAAGTLGLVRVENDAAQPTKKLTGEQVSTRVQMTMPAVPESGSMLLLGFSLLGLASLARRRTARKQQ